MHPLTPALMPGLYVGGALGAGGILIPWGRKIARPGRAGLREAEESLHPLLQLHTVTLPLLPLSPSRTLWSSGYNSLAISMSENPRDHMRAVVSALINPFPSIMVRVIR